MANKKQQNVDHNDSSINREYPAHTKKIHEHEYVIQNPFYFGFSDTLRN